MRGIERWADRTAAGEAWFASVQMDDGSAKDMPKEAYEAEGVEPPFWNLRKRRRSYSAVVATGMNRVSADFSDRIEPLGFKKTGSRRWARITDGRRDEIWIERCGSTYGAPISASVDLRIWLGVRDAEASASKGFSLRCDGVRRPDGRAYHHRFNADSFDTYDRCLDELCLFISEFADAWFERPEQR